jgi:hypothetical protein
MVFKMAVPSAPVRKWFHVDSFVAMDFSCTESCNTEIQMFTSCGKVDIHTISVLKNWEELVCYANRATRFSVS